MRSRLIQYILLFSCDACSVRKDTDNATAMMYCGNDGVAEKQYNMNWLFLLSYDRLLVSHTIRLAASDEIDELHYMSGIVLK